jgi:predicted nucleotidyltransferase
MNLSAPHRSFLERALEVLGADLRVVGVAAAGSYISGQIDEHSDLDLVIAVADADRERAIAARRRIAEALGPLLSAFTGDHVGEPERLLICLYGPPLLHVDLKIVSLSELGDRVENPIVLFDRDGQMTTAIANTAPAPPRLDLEWLAARFWTWVHYGTAKASRGELYECLDLLGFLRGRVLGPMALYASGQRGLDAQGLRRFERLANRWAPRLAATVGGLDRDSCLAAISTCCDIYVELRDALGLEPDGAVEAEVRRYLAAAARGA